MRIPTSTKPSMACWSPPSATRDRSARPVRAPLCMKRCTSPSWKNSPKVKALPVGPADDPRNYMGPVISEGARKSILQYIETGKKEGRVIAGGTTVPGDGYFIAPTVIADVEPSARLLQEEIFGPVLDASKARDSEHALELANNSEYGLTGA